MSSLWHASIRGDFAWVAARSQRRRSGEIAAMSQLRGRSDVAVRSQQGRSEVAATFPEYMYFHTKVAK